MRLLDLFCGAGGASMGYALAGFAVCGVDIKPQPHYPFQFIQADVLGFTVEDLASYDVIHASPPCQAHVKGFAAANKSLNRDNSHPTLIPVIRDLLVASGKTYVIENVVGAPLQTPIQLCGSSFGLGVRRHRLFESNATLKPLQCKHHLQTEKKYWTGWCPNGERRLATVAQVYGNGGGRDQWAEAMGIDWMTPKELTQAIPPKYTEYIGRQLPLQTLLE